MARFGIFYSFSHQRITRNAKSDDQEKSDAYFEGRKRLMQTVIQGQFKRPVSMGDVYVGSLFARPFAGAPPESWTKVMDAVIRRIAPGLILDLSSTLPKVIAILAGTAQTMSIDEPGSKSCFARRARQVFRHS